MTLLSAVVLTLQVAFVKLFEPKLPEINEFGPPVIEKLITLAMAWPETKSTSTRTRNVFKYEDRMISLRLLGQRYSIKPLKYQILISVQRDSSPSSQVPGEPTTGLVRWRRNFQLPS